METMETISSNNKKSISSQTIPSGCYKLILGESFNRKLSNENTFKTIRYDFKPKSVSASTETYLAFADSNEVIVAVPSTSDSNKKKDGVLTWFKGSEKPTKADKECLLIFDHDTGGMRLEQLRSTISVKKTRGDDCDSDGQIRAAVERMQEKVHIRQPDEILDESKWTNDSTMEKSETKMISNDSSEESDSDQSSSDDQYQEQIEKHMSSSKTSNETGQGGVCPTLSARCSDPFPLAKDLGLHLSDSSDSND